MGGRELWFYLLFSPWPGDEHNRMSWCRPGGSTTTTRMVACMLSGRKRATQTATGRRCACSAAGSHRHVLDNGQPASYMHKQPTVCMNVRRGAASERWQRAAISNWSVITDWSLWAAAMDWSDGFFADEFLFAGHYIGCRRRVPRRTAHVMEIVCRVVGVVAGWRFGR
jgi:hypothetical protein